MTCRWAFRMRTVNLGSIVICQAVGGGLRLTVPISECGTYDDKRMPSLNDMREIAWQVQTKKRGAVGFSPDTASTIEIEPPNRYDTQGAPAMPTNKPIGEDK